MKYITWFIDEIRWEWSTLTRTGRVWEVAKFATVFVIGTFVILLLTGCTTLTEYERADRENLRIEKFYLDEAVCKANGGWLEIKRHGSLTRRCMSRSCPARKGEQYRCVK